MDPKYLWLNLTLVCLMLTKALRTDFLHWGLEMVLGREQQTLWSWRLFDPIHFLWKTLPRGQAG